MWRRRRRASKQTRYLGEKNRGCPRLLGDWRAVCSQPPSQQRAVCTEQCTLSLFGSSVCARKVNRATDWLFRTRMAPQIVCLNYCGQKNKFRRWNQFDIYHSSAETPTPAEKNRSRLQRRFAFTCRSARRRNVQISSRLQPWLCDAVNFNCVAQIHQFGMLSTAELSPRQHISHCVTIALAAKTQYFVY